MNETHAQNLERAIAAAALALCTALCAMAWRSPLGAGHGAPFIFRLSLRGSEGAEEGRYLAVYSWNRRSLDLVKIGKEEPDLASLGREAGVELEERLPAGFHAGSPESLKAWIASWPRDLRFWADLPGAVSRLRRASKGRISRFDAVVLALEAYRLAPDGIRPSWLPPEPEGKRLLGMLLTPDSAPRISASTLRSRTSAVTVEVLNAAGEPGVALSVTKILRSRGADVLEFGNAANAAAQTQIIDRTGDFEAARLVRDALGCAQAGVVTQMRKGSGTAVTAVIGTDYKECAGLAAGR